MSPENARVFLAEDDKNLRPMLRRIITGSSHEVVIEVGTLDEALSTLKQAQELGVNIAVVDGNLTKDDTSGYDGTRIAEELRKEIPGIKIVSCSGQQQSYGDVHVDKNILKEVINLGEVITKL